MERPTKRPRLSFTPGSPEGVPEEWDLQTARAQNDRRLKSVFEGIFTKYGRDFTEVGDEIDLETGKIIVDNGHLLGMREETDTGNKASWLYGDGADWEDENQDPDEGPNETQNGHLDNRAEHDELGWSDTESDDSILDSALAHPDSPKPGARPLSKVHTSLEQVDKHAGPKDPLWQAPEIPRLFSTPTAERRHAKAAFSPQLPNVTRESSPPGSGSLWTVPRRGRPRTEGKPKATPTKRRSPARPKYHSSPVARDWSFAKAPEGDESDDPLQEFQPSPTPSRLTSVRGKSRKCPPYPLNKDLHTTRQSSTQAEPVSQDQSAAAPGPEVESQDDSPIHLAEQGDTEKHVAYDALQLQSDSSARSHTQADRKPPSQNTSSEIYDGMTPDEAKLIVCMRYVQKRTWKEILAALPSHRMSQISAFNYHHWYVRRENPPQLSAPWSPTELATLEELKDQSGLSWSEIMCQMPGRSRAEIEFELLHLWVGDEVWFGEERGEGSEESSVPLQNDRIEDEEREQQEADLPEPSAPIQRPLVTEAPGLGPSTPARKRSRTFEEFLEDDESESDISEASSPSKLSAIHLDSPARSRQGSRTPSRASPVKRVKLM